VRIPTVPASPILRTSLFSLCLSRLSLLCKQSSRRLFTHQLDTRARLQLAPINFVQSIPGYLFPQRFDVELFCTVIDTKSLSELCSRITYGTHTRARITLSTDAIKKYLSFYDSMIYIYMYIYIHIIYIYIYISKLSLCIYIYIYMQSDSFDTVR